MKSIFSRIINKLFGKFIQKKIFLDGVRKYEQTGITTGESYQALIKLYCLTNGKFDANYHQQTKGKNPPVSVPPVIKGITDTFTKSDFDKINDRLNKDGYIHFEKKLPEDICNRIYQYALQTKATIPPAYDKPLIYDPANPVAEIYRFDMVELANNKDFQVLMMDPALINIARNYLECEPIFDFPAMWWSTSINKEASSEAAQLYHFDMDRVKWLKLFIYLNDVDENNGPHAYIRGSHKPGSKPASLLKKGYARIKDVELAEFYKKEDFVTVFGKQGEMFAGDTKCWHKGTPLKKGNRLVVELEYSSSLFGANQPKMVITNYSTEFKIFCEANPLYASHILFK